MKFVYEGDHHGETVGIAMPILDLHGRPLVPPLVVPADDIKTAFIVTAGRPFVIDHKDFERGMHAVCEWMCSHQKFRVLDRELRPKGRG